MPSLSCYRLIIILLLYLNPNPKSLSTLSSYNKYRLRFFPQEELSVPANCILLKQEGMFYMSAKDITTTGILDGIL